MARVGVAALVDRDRVAARSRASGGRSNCPVRARVASLDQHRILVSVVRVREARGHRVDGDAHREEGRQAPTAHEGLLPFMVVLGVLNLLVILEPDLSMAMMFTLIMGIMLFAGGVRIGHVIFLGVIAIPLLWQQVERVQYALLRMTTFLDPGSANLSAAGYQLKQSLIAVGSGGLFGVGFGMGRQQLGFVPFPYNDFIGANIGEEWGFFGILFVTLLFAAYGYIGFRIAQQARTPFQQLLAVGLTFMTVSTAFLHIGVVIGLLPTTGLTLPFVSFGRTNLVLSMLMTGILVNIGSTRERVVGANATNPLERAPA